MAEGMAHENIVSSKEWAERKLFKNRKMSVGRTEVLQSKEKEDLIEELVIVKKEKAARVDALALTKKELVLQTEKKEDLTVI